MRRVFSIVALVALSWSQVLGVKCPFAAAHGGGGEPSSRRLTMGMHRVSLLTESGAIPVSRGTDCRVAMTCAWAMTDPAAAVPDFASVAPLHRYSGSVRAPHATADLLADPPPPRLTA